MIKSRLGDRVGDWLQALLPFLFRVSINPNVLTVMGALVSIASGAAFAVGWFGWGAIGILVGGIFDLTDGVMARRHGTSTPFGAFLDSTLDRLADMVILLGIMLHYAAAGDAPTVLLAGVAMIAAVMTSYAKARAEQFVPGFRGGFLERAERLIVLGLGAVSGYMIPALWVLAVLGTATVARRIAIAYRQLASLGAEEPHEVGERP